MSLPTSELYGVREDLGAKLHAAGYANSDQLLAAAAHPKDREALATQLGIDTKEVLELANRADLARIKGVGKVYSDLLEWSGVDTVAELAQRNPANLHEKILEAAEMHFVKRIPTADEVADWVTEAKSLDRALFY
jgi:predicted flap endonuclease-1-like 5' DNA nuclease